MDFGYFWPYSFSDCIEAVKQCPNCSLYAPKARFPPAPLHPVVTVGPFYKWVIIFMECRTPYTNKQKYIIMVVDCFTKWVEAMPTFNNIVATMTLFFFNHVIARFVVLKQLVSDHGRHFEDEIWHELSSLLGFEHQYSSSYYPRGNGQVKSINKILKTMLQQFVSKHKGN